MKKAILLVLFGIISVVLLILTAAFIFGSLHEKNFAEREKNTIQAMNLAEAGLHQGIEELKTKMNTDLSTIVQNETPAHLGQYAGEGAAKDSLDFLDDYLNFTCQRDAVDSRNDQAIFAVAPLALTTNVAGALYSANIVIRKQKDAAGNDLQASSPSADMYIFPYEFRIEAQGRVNATGRQGIITKSVNLTGGKFTVTVQRGNFARYALFTNHHSSPSGDRVWFTEKTKFYGPVHTNDQLNFANNPGAYFSDDVTQHHDKAYFHNNGWPRQLDQDSNSPYDVPTFAQGFQRGVNEINLESSITPNNLREKVGYASAGSDGIYVANNGASVTGGIYIKGQSDHWWDHSDDATIILGGSGSVVTYSIKQGDSTPRIITVDYLANGGTGSTTLTNPSATYQGIPDGIDHNGILIYSDDDIASISGTVASASQATVSSERDIVITSHIRYEQYHPKTETEFENALGYTNLLGILSWGGDVRIASTAPSNLDIHAIVLSVHGVFTVDNYRTIAAKDNANLLGGAITDSYGPFGTFSGTTQLSGYGRRFIYDARMLEGMAPPYYPTLSYFVADAPELKPDLANMNINWQDQ